MSLATIAITTRNRKEDLVKSLASVMTQSVPVEVLVIDDGSTDGTSEMVRNQFPQVQLHRFETSSGLIVRRNRAAAMAESPIIFSLDDDAFFSSPFVVEQPLREFDDPRVGAVAIPFVDVNTSPEIKQKAPDANGIYATYSYIGTAHAGYTDLTKRYISWYKTGVPPATNQDVLYYFYRIHSMNLVATHDIPVTWLLGDVSDVVYNTLFLTAPAQLLVSSGTNSATYSLGSGLQQIRTPFAPGTQTFTVMRNGNPVASVQGPPILSSITNYDYFPASGYAYGLQAPTNLVAHP
jgi:glycosyltransferase involved in cell wall biosynthesis